MSPTQILVTAVVIGVGSNLDNTGVGLAYGTADRRIPHRINALMNAIGFIAVIIGGYLGRVIAPYLSADTAAQMSCGVLVAVGLSCWYLGYIRPKLHGEPPRRLHEPGWQMGVALGLGLSATNVANGFGASVSHADLLWPTIISITVFGYLMIWIGDFVASSYSRGG